MKYRVIESPTKGGRPGLSVGTEVFEYRGHDYGSASTDSMFLGERFISVTLVEGETPFFTIPVNVLEEV